MPPSLLCHFLSVPKGGIVSKFDCRTIIVILFWWSLFAFPSKKITISTKRIKNRYNIILILSSYQMAAVGEF